MEDQGISRDIRDHLSGSGSRACVQLGKAEYVESLGGLTIYRNDVPEAYTMLEGGEGSDIGNRRTGCDLRRIHDVFVVVDQARFIQLEDRRRPHLGFRAPREESH